LTEERKYTTKKLNLTPLIKVSEITDFGDSKPLIIKVPIYTGRASLMWPLYSISGSSLIEIK